MTKQNSCAALEADALPLGKRGGSSKEDKPFVMVCRNRSIVGKETVVVKVKVITDAVTYSER